MPKTLVTPTKSEYAVREIRKRILAGAYKPGDRLHQQRLAADLNLGITPVREALLQLTSEGLLDRIPYAGVLVSDMTVDAVRDIYELRRLLEGPAARQACIHAGPADLDRLQAFVQCMAAEQDEQAYQQLNERFHMSIYQLTRNGVLCDTIAMQWRRFPRDTLTLMPHRRSQSLAEHAGIVEAFLQHDPECAETRMVAHIAAAQYNVTDLLRRRGGVGVPPQSN